MIKALLFCLLFSSTLFSQSSLSLWKSYPLPDEKQLKLYNRSDTSWILSVDVLGNINASNMQIPFSLDLLPFKVKPDTVKSRRRGLKTVLMVDNGYLAGFNRGEWGSELAWYSFNGDSTYYISTDDQIHGIFQLGSHIFYLAGSTYILSDSGDITDAAIKELYFNNGIWQIKRTMNLPNEPQTYFLDSGKVFIVALREILVFDKIKEIQFIKKNGFWRSLYPESIIVKNNVIYIGMRKGVYKFNIVTQKEEWLMPE